MNAKQAHKLLNVAKALREGAPENFDMAFWGHTDYAKSCGTPACALGHYASRRDLQKSLKLGKMNEILLNNNHSCRDAFAKSCDIFGITVVEAGKLFDTDGCGNADTNKAAARYIEKFVKNKRKEAKR